MQLLHRRDSPARRVERPLDCDAVIRDEIPMLFHPLAVRGPLCYREMRPAQRLEIGV